MIFVELCSIEMVFVIEGDGSSIEVDGLTAVCSTDKEVVVVELITDLSTV